MMAVENTLGLSTPSPSARRTSAAAQRIGVTHADVNLPRDFTPVVGSSSLPENTMARGQAQDTDVLVVRQHGRV
jgi:hypothetical protein